MSHIAHASSFTKSVTLTHSIWHGTIGLSQMTSLPTECHVHQHFVRQILMTRISCAVFRRHFEQYAACLEHFAHCAHTHLMALNTQL